MSKGVLQARVACPADAPFGSRLVLTAALRGTALSASPPPVPVGPLVFDSGAGVVTDRTISDDGTTLTTAGRAAHLFRGRTACLRIPARGSLCIGVEVTVSASPSHGVLALASKDTIASNTYDFASNKEHQFFYNMYDGGVRVAHAGSTGHPQLRTANAVHVFVLHIKDRELSLSAGAQGAPLTAQPGGPWTLPEDCYILIADYSVGQKYRLFWA